MPLSAAKLAGPEPRRTAEQPAPWPAPRWCRRHEETEEEEEVEVLHELELASEGGV